MDQRLQLKSTQLIVDSKLVQNVNETVEFQAKHFLYDNTILNLLDLETSIWNGNIL